MTQHWEGWCPVCNQALRLWTLPDPDTVVACPNSGGCGKHWWAGGREHWQPTRLTVRLKGEEPCHT